MEVLVWTHPKSFLLVGCMLGTYGKIHPVMTLMRVTCFVQKGEGYWDSSSKLPFPPGPLITSTGQICTTVKDLKDKTRRSRLLMISIINYFVPFQTHWNTFSASQQSDSTSEFLVYASKSHPTQWFWLISKQISKQAILSEGPVHWDFFSFSAESSWTWTSSFSVQTQFYWFAVA